MAHVTWSQEYEIGVPIIDRQHQRIVDYINRLHDVSDTGDRAVVSDVIDNLVDYTYSHLAFEESLMEESGYDALDVHQGTHQAFIRRLDQLRGSFTRGEDVASQLASMLQTWLLEHIMTEDSSYAPVVKQRFLSRQESKQASWISNAISRFFR